MTIKIFSIQMAPIPSPTSSNSPFGRIKYEGLLDSFIIIHMKNTLKVLWEWHNNVNKNVQPLVFVQCSCARLMVRYPGHEYERSGCTICKLACFKSWRWEVYTTKILYHSTQVPACLTLENSGMCIHKKVILLYLQSLKVGK